MGKTQRKHRGAFPPKFVRDRLRAETYQLDPGRKVRAPISGLCLAWWIVSFEGGRSWGNRFRNGIRAPTADGPRVGGGSSLRAAGERRPGLCFTDPGKLIRFWTYCFLARLVLNLGECHGVEVEAGSLIRT